MEDVDTSSPTLESVTRPGGLQKKPLFLANHRSDWPEIKPGPFVGQAAAQGRHSPTELEGISF
jgi:hypothetical protein